MILNHYIVESISIKNKTCKDIRGNVINLRPNSLYHIRVSETEIDTYVVDKNLNVMKQKSSNVETSNISIGSFN